MAVLILLIALALLVGSLVRLTRAGPMRWALGDERARRHERRLEQIRNKPHKKKMRDDMSNQHALYYRKVIQRDGEFCQNCGSSANLQIDHIHPVSRGGTNALDNLQLLCRQCNRSKGDQPAYVKFDASWHVSVPGRNLDTVKLTLIDTDEDEITDTATIDVSGTSASGTTTLKARRRGNHTYEARLLATDNYGRFAQNINTNLDLTMRRPADQ